ncbi:MAG: hypothetical protein NT040_00440 [Bacteroidetes bacterium]|nr:hypothetical protein [Bacteroidota bacterium]
MKVIAINGSPKKEGIRIMRVLGKTMAWLMKMKEVAPGTIQPPVPEKKVVTNFIR